MDGSSRVLIEGIQRIREEFWRSGGGWKEVDEEEEVVGVVVVSMEREVKAMRFNWVR